MSDIVERLRKLWFEQDPKLTWDDMEAITEEAADEIETLRAEIEEVKRLYKYHVDLVSQGICEGNKLRAENEKLRTENEKMRTMWDETLLRAIPVAAALKETGGG